ncbi:MAG: hypothetical protein A2622_00835 [Bdellovibrionales bacterium RIFCSPHIGHO2_01_FULL_40_29]|nr:MAG: hypothetical protein A2622_00835 [Bdellovibrionales bacterium RIFCSPHIGHO2_01_FULL_40_29]OFZ32662.1 MAG: hypothetical protein A3D17_05435 [Bdellovibrionales bacterium RIFCSPHIGHO2_02_FULL_40_15]
MFSKWQLRSQAIFTVMLTAITLAGCGLKIGEANKSETTAEVQAIACLDSSIADLKLFTVGEATDEQVASSLQCLQDVFISFKENIRGEHKDAYTAKEIALFIEKNFIKDGKTFSDAFLAEVMKFKVALIGGSSLLVRETEIDQVVSLLTSLKPDILRLNKSMKIITFKWISQFHPESEDEKEKLFLIAKTDFNRFVQKLAQQFAQTGNAYLIDDLFNFVREVLIFAKGESETVQFFEKVRPFLKTFKTVLIGGDNSLKASEWERLGSTLHEGLFQALRYEYFLKDLSDQDIETKWRGYEKMAIDLSGLVENLLDVKETQTLSNFELFEITQTLVKIFPDFSLNMQLIESIGHLKVMMLGDSPSGRIGWSKSDFSKLRTKIPKLFQQIATLVQTYDYLQRHKNPILTWSTTSPEEFLSIESKTLVAVESLAELIERPYSLYYLKILIQELAKGPLSEELVLPENFESLYSAALSIKTVLTGEEDNTIGVTNLKTLLVVGARAFLHVTEYNIFTVPYKIDEPGFYTHLDRIFEKIIKTVSLNLELKSSKMYSSEELISLILTLQQEDIINTELKDQSLAMMFEGLWKNLLNDPAGRLGNQVLPGFNSVALAQVSNEMRGFIGSQKVVGEIFGKQETITKSLLLTEIRKAMVAQKDPLVKASLRELQTVLSSVISLNFNSHDFLKILTLDLGQYSYKDTFKSNLGRAFSRLFIRSYAGDMSRVSKLKGVTVTEAEVAFKQFKSIAVDFEVIDISNETFMSARFMEANLFLATSNGDLYANFTEVHDIFLHILSGMARAKMLKERIIEACLPPQQDRISSKTGVWEFCLLKTYYNEMVMKDPATPYFGSYLDLPQMLQMRNQFSAQEVKEYFYSLVKAAGHVPNDKEVVYFEDADLFPHVLQYIEMVYARHDSNKDGVLEKCEALGAFPIFHDLIKELTAEYKLKEDQLPGTFIYLLKFSRPPKTLAEKFKFLSFINTPEKWVIASTRIDLGKIFNFIADETRAKKEKAEAQQPPVTPAEPVAPQPPVTPVEPPAKRVGPPPEPIVTGC